MPTKDADGRAIRRRVRTRRALHADFCRARALEQIVCRPSHMLTFLAIACKQKFVLDSYEDETVGHMEKNADGKMAITRVELRPKITWSGNRRPSVEELDKMHHAAHENCFIANSVKTNVTVAER